MTFGDDYESVSDRIEDHREAVDFYFGAGHPDDEDYPIDARHDLELELDKPTLTAEDLAEAIALKAAGDELGAQRLILDRLSNR